MSNDETGTGWGGITALIAVCMAALPTPARAQSALQELKDSAGTREMRAAPPIREERTRAGFLDETLDEINEAQRGFWHGRRQPKAPSEARLRDALPVIRKGVLESRSAFLERAQGEIKDVLILLFPPKQAMSGWSDAYRVELDDHRCGPERETSYPGLHGYADWELDGWRYTVELYACSRDPLYVKYASITPADGTRDRMPKTKEEFVSLVNRLAYVNVREAEERVDYDGRPRFYSSLSPDGRSYVEISHLGLLDGSKDAGAVFFSEMNDAEYRYFKNGRFFRPGISARTN